MDLPDVESNREGIKWQCEATIKEGFREEKHKEIVLVNEAVVGSECGYIFSDAKSSCQVDYECESDYVSPNKSATSSAQEGLKKLSSGSIQRNRD